VSDLHFAHPLFFWALTSLPFFAALIFHAEKKRRIALDKLIAARLQPRLAGSASVTRRRWGFAMLLLGLALAITALARPQWGFTWEEKKQRGRDIIFAIDVSKSMLATDLLPNRLTRAKLAAEDLLKQLEGDRVGLIAFAGTAFLQAPLTSDFSAVRESLQELDTDIIPRGGTDLADAIRAADEAFGKGESEHRALIFFSDGEELEEDAVIAARKNKDRFHIFTVGLGSPEGSLIPVPAKGGGTEFLKDDDGSYVKTKLDEPRMREVAEAGGGFYVALRDGPAEMQRIVRDGLGKMKEAETDAKFSRVPIERYQWPLAAAIAALAAALLIGERRRVAKVAQVAAAALVLLAARAEARHEGIEKFDAKDYTGSLGAFDDDLKKRDGAELQFDAGAAAYELGDYARAAASFSKALGTASPELKNRAAYNLGNTLARRALKHEKKEDKLGDLKDAVRQYDEVLKSEPKHEDAQHNREIVNKLIAELEKEEKQEQQKQDDQKKDEKKDKDKDQKDQQNQSQGGKDDQQKQKQDSQQKDGDGKDQKDQKDSKDGKQQQKSQGDGKDDPKKDKGESGKDGEQKDKQDSSQQKQEGKNDPGADKKDGQQQNADNKQGDQKPQPQPKDGGDEKPKSGEVQAANPSQQQPQDNQQAADAAEAAQAAQAAQEGRMTEKDAAKILEAMKHVDFRVRLLDPKDAPVKNPNKPFKNW
jgi:Ca-activated chloride channel family protein